MSSRQHYNKSLKLTREACEGYLDKLDSQAHPNLGGHKRRSARQPYRTLLKVEIFQPNIVPITYAALTRNLSKIGAAFLIGQFVHRGTPCELQLETNEGRKHIAKGEIVRCRYIDGSIHLYEVGMKFHKPVELDALEATSEAVKTRILLADDDPLLHRLVSKILKTMCTDLTCAHTGKEAVAKAIEASPDLVLMDIDMPEMDGIAAASELRSKNFLEPLVAVTAMEDQDAPTRCIKAGFDDYLKKPFSQAALLSQVSEMIREPLTSSMAGQSEMADLINEFVESLTDQIKELNLAFNQQDFDTLKTITRQIKGRAGAYGFQPITDVAARLERIIESDGDINQISAAIKELLHLCRSAQPVETPKEPAVTG